MSREPRKSLTHRFPGSPGAWTAFRVGNTDITIDPTWLLIFAFVTWTTSTSIIPARLGLRAADADGLIWLAGVITSLLFFGSILAHEAAHAYVAVRTGIPVGRIRLFVFGGVAEIAREPSRPRQEFAITIVGPIASGALGGILLLASSVLPDPSLGRVTLGWLGQINVVLAIFNMLPGLPLDGGRVLRSAVWGATGNLRLATRVASFGGSALGILLILHGAIPLAISLFGLRGLAALPIGIDPLWSIFIGWFLWSAARASLREAVRRERLCDRTVWDIMRHDHIPVPEDGTVAEFTERGLHKDRFGFHPVVNDRGMLVGILTTNLVLRVPEQTRATTRLREVARRPDPVETISPTTDLVKAIDQICVPGLERLYVLDSGRLVGWVDIRDLFGSLGAPNPT